MTRIVYSGLSLAFRDADWTFMNYGFSALDAGDAELRLDPADEADRLSIQLYDQVVGAQDLHGKDVLEIGCGRGGGSSFIARYRHPASMTGVDLSESAVRFCRRRHPLACLKFLRGDAERLPLPSSAFDAVINVESSHAYPSFERFIDEVVRVLRPGGAFLFADLRGPEDVAPMRRHLAARFTIEEEELITPNVVRALELDSERRMLRIQERTPRFLHKRLRSFAGVAGSPVFDSFVSGDLQYIRFVLRAADGRPPGELRHSA